MGCRHSRARSPVFQDWVQEVLKESDTRLDPDFEQYLTRHSVGELIGQAITALNSARPFNAALFMRSHFEQACMQRSKSSRITGTRRSLPRSSSKKSAYANMAQSQYGVSVSQSTPRMLVLTDVGEEIDDEAALWLLSKHLDHVSCNWEADVVFATGSPVQRAARWSNILDSLGGESIPGEGQMAYSVGPKSGRTMRYSEVDMGPLLGAGGGELKPYGGGSYDVILQISPLDGFSDDFSSTAAESVNEPSTALSRVKRRPGSRLPVYIVVGGEGSTNFLLDNLHKGFKQMLIDRGFKAVHVEKSNYTPWRASYLQEMPHQLCQLVMADEWNKAVGRIPPEVANLLVRFRVNTLVNYDLVEKAYAAYHTAYGSYKSHAKACEWWSGIHDMVHDTIGKHYVGASRDNDSRAKNPFGNPSVSSLVNGQSTSWSSIVSHICKRQIMEHASITEDDFEQLYVDDVLCRAVLLMTQKLLIIYAFNSFEADRTPLDMEYMPYLLGQNYSSDMLGGGVEGSTPLHFSNFPRLKDDFSQVKKAVLGSPMYDPSGMLVAMLVMDATARQQADVVRRLSIPEPLLDSTALMDVMTASLGGCGPAELGSRYFPEAAALPRLLVLTAGCGSADEEAALWLMSRFQKQEDEGFMVDVVFMSGTPLRGAMRWASVLNSLRKEEQPSPTHIRYLLGAGSQRKLDYQVIYDHTELSRAGMGDLPNSPFMGGQYDVIIQCSPLGDFSADFSNRSSNDIKGSLARIHPRSGAKAPLLIVVGKSGSHHFPADGLHFGFKQMLESRGFSSVHVVQSERMPYLTGDIVELLPATLQEVVLREEWDRVTDNAPSKFSNLYKKFTIITNTKFTQVNRTYRVLKEMADTKHLSMAEAWWESVQDQVKALLEEHYLKMVRDQDDAEYKPFRNPLISEVIYRRNHTWESTMSQECFAEICQMLPKGEENERMARMPVLDALSRSVFLLVGKLLRIYATICFMSNVLPNGSQAILYVSGSTSSPPLDFKAFPEIRGLGRWKMEAVGSSLMKSFAMICAVGASCGGEEVRTRLKAMFDNSQPDMAPDAWAEAVVGAYVGRSASELMQTLLDISKDSKRVTSSTSASMDSLSWRRSVSIASADSVAHFHDRWDRGKAKQTERKVLAI